jgi:hypothetical protein
MLTLAVQSRILFPDSAETDAFPELILKLGH